MARTMAVGNKKHRAECEGLSISEGTAAEPLVITECGIQAL